MEKELVKVEGSLQEDFVRKFSLLQSELKAPKGQKNSFGNYKYRSCEDILEAVKPLLQKYGFILNLSDEIVLVGERYYVKAYASISDEKNKKQVTAYAREALLKKGMDEAQITGSASSYARKYALNGLLCIDDTKDAETMDNSKEEPLKRPTSTSKTPASNKIADLKIAIDDICKSKNYTSVQLENVCQSNFGKGFTKLTELELERLYKALSK